MKEDAPSDAGAREKSGWTIAGITCALLLVLYVGGYFAVVEYGRWTWMGMRPVPFWTDDEGSHPRPTELGLGDGPDYHGLPGWFFAPIHEADRRWLRPSRWWWRLSPGLNPIGSVRFYDDVFPEEKAPVKSSSR